ncbi:hypothetical protein PFISCL1PPCAC_24594, partial [Pristionchus fissidentatus]
NTFLQTVYASYQPSVGGSPIVLQPGSSHLHGLWVSLPPHVPGCPPGLEFLYGRDKIVIKEKQQLIEYLAAIEMSNRYTIETPSGEQIYCMGEESRFIQAQLMGSNRGYRIRVVDGYNRVAFTIARPLQFCKWSCCACCSCCQRQGKVEGGGVTIGTMHTRQSCWSSALSIMDEHGEEVLTIDGPCACSYCCSDATFKLRSSSTGAVVGHIKRKFKGCLRSTFTKRNNFEIEFPADIDVKTKASIIGACIMIDFEQFEKAKHNRENGQ